MYEKKPYVTVITTEKIAESKKIDFKTVYESTDALYKGEVKVKDSRCLRRRTGAVGSR